MKCPKLTCKRPKGFASNVVNIRSTNNLMPRTFNFMPCKQKNYQEKPFAALNTITN